jgi:predicted ATP-grasp superfamily ATP-dependent carboligase
VSLRRPILVCEYLLADPAEWQKASPSMRLEAEAMLTAVVQDLCQLEDVRPAVLLSTSAASMLRSSGRIDPNTEIIVANHGPMAWLREPSYAPTSFDATLVIAPECRQILVSLLKQIQSDAWKSVWNLNVPCSMAEIFSDKYWTFQWLRNHGISTPPTKTLDDADCDSFCVDRLFLPHHPGGEKESLPDSCGLSIIKPRDGVGCDGIRLIPMRQSRFDRQPSIRVANDPWILQRYLPGVPCSVGFIGGGSVQPTVILPPGQQDIRLDDRCPGYYGGQIPCGPHVASAVVEVADQLAREFGSFSGYVGADLVVTRDTRGISEAHVIEINPRLCTSYVGYRALAKDNLAAALLQQSQEQPFRWNSGTVHFDSAGNVEMVDQVP